MKRIFYIWQFAIILIISFSATTMALPYHTFYPVSPIKVTIQDGCYIIRWNIPDYTMSDILSSEGNFVKMSFDNDIEGNACFHTDRFQGLPELPFFSLNLHVPDTTLTYDIDSIEYGDDIFVDYPYIPHQINGEDFSFDSEYYNSTPEGWMEFYYISPVYKSVWGNGVNVRIRPFGYDPQTGVIRPILSFKVRICLSGNESLLEMYENAINNAGYSDAISFFTTYFGATSNELVSGANCSGNYLILTTSQFEEQAEQYRQHKENMGYNATLELVDGLTNTQIIEYLAHQGVSPETRPKYVLIIGYKRRPTDSEEGVPFSGGYSVMGPNTYIDTDIFYACYDKTPNSENQLLMPQTLVGRWMVSTPDELDFIMQKSIDFEFEEVNRRMAVFSGYDSGSPNWFHSESQAMTDIISTSASGISWVYYNGQDGISRSEMLDEFSYNDDFMFIYNGHGNAEMMCEPYNARASHFSSVENLPYFGLGFACSLAMTSSDVGFACQWLNTCPRTCAFYGATCPVIEAFELGKDIVHIMDQPMNLTIGQLVYGGFGRYSIDYMNSIAHGGVYGGGFNPVWMNAPFILYGDPSLYIYGMSWPGHPAQYVPNRSTITEETPAVMKIYNARGILIQNRFGVTDNANSYGQDLPIGINFVVEYDELGNVISTKKVIKNE